MYISLVDDVKNIGAFFALNDVWPGHEHWPDVVEELVSAGQTSCGAQGERPSLR